MNGAVEVETSITPEDLSANRLGQLSPRQLANLRAFQARNSEPVMAGRLSADLSTGRVEVSDGKGWYGEAVADSIKGLSACRGLPLYPGRYRFYYLPNSKLVVAAEALEPLSGMLQRHREELLEALQLSVAGLELNRAGRLTTEQSALQRVNLKWSLLGLGLMLSAALAAAALDSLSFSFGFLFIAGICAIRALVWLRRGQVRTYTGSLVEKSVTFSEPAFLRFSDGSRHRSFDFEDNVNQRITNLMIVGARYHVYHSGRDFAVAVEPAN